MTMANQFPDGNSFIGKHPVAAGILKASADRIFPNTSKTVTSLISMSSTAKKRKEEAEKKKAARLFGTDKPPYNQGGGPRYK